MHALAASLLAAVVLLAVAPAHADADPRVDLVVRDAAALVSGEVSRVSPTDAAAAPALLADAPARPTPLEIRLDATGHVALRLRVQRDLFLGKLVLAL